MKKLLLFLLAGTCLYSSASVRLPKIFSDNMVLQRNTYIPVWGWAASGSTITVELFGNSKSVRVSADGSWKVMMDPVQAGGPFELKISGDGELTYKNVLIGEVWFASGQSNMQFDMHRVNNSAAEIKDAQNFSAIRLFRVPNVISIKPENDMKDASWMICDSNTVKDFSAVGFFFARHINKDMHVPVGIIEAAWGGTCAEAWTSYDMLASMKEFRGDVKKLQDAKENYDQLVPDNSKNYKVQDSLIKHSDKGEKAGVTNPDYDDAAWKIHQVPFDLLNTDRDFGGFAWFRKTIDIPKQFRGKELKLVIGRMGSDDMTYFNGSLIGKMGSSVQVVEYTIPKKLVREGKNVIAIRLMKSTRGGAGIIGTPLRIVDPKTNTEVVSLAGDWKYNTGIETPFPKIYSLANNPAALFNAMVNPVIPYAIKGAIWYQGEANGSEGYQYRELLPKMITDWRVRWGEGYFPFFYVQIANFLKKDSLPAMDPWPEMREAQLMTLSLPNVAMASAIDLGETWDIHPRNKQDVAARLYLCAQSMAYGSKKEYMGPVYNGYKVEGDKIRIYFTHTGSGLKFRNFDKPAGFAIAGKDQKFVWADAVIDGNTVLVSAKTVSEPAAVRYGWSNNPDICLYNTEDLPASPFRTDDWPLMSFGKSRYFDLDFLK